MVHTLQSLTVDAKVGARFESASVLLSPSLRCSGVTDALRFPLDHRNEALENPGRKQYGHTQSKDKRSFRPQPVRADQDSCELRA